MIDAICLNLSGDTNQQSLSPHYSLKSQIMKAYTMKQSGKRARISGTSTQGLNITQKLHSNQGMNAFRLQNKTALNVRLNLMDEDSRREYDAICHLPLEADSVDMDSHR